MKRLLLLIVLLLIPTSMLRADELTDKLQDLSVTIKSGYGQGSGTIFSRDGFSFVWTAAHVIDNLRKTREVVVNGATKTVVEFDDAQVVQEFREDGRRIGEIKMEAEVLRYSDAQDGEDLALLRIRKKNFTPNSIVFYDGKAIPSPGTELYHVGSLLGQVGANSLTTGIVSQTGRVLRLGANGVVFDQTTVTAFPGSSGGGVFLKTDGQYVGMLVRGAGEQFNLVVPIRRLRSWAKAAKVEWAIDPSIALPSEEELRKLPVEDSGVSFAPGSDPRGDHKDYPFLLKFPDGVPTLAE